MRPLVATPRPPRRLHLALLLGTALGAAPAGCSPPAGVAGARELSPASIAPVATARYLANAGVLVTAGETKIAFDPIFRQDFGEYQLLPVELERALFAAEPPFDGLDAVLISHYHDDHFSPADVRRLLEQRREVQLYAPEQAVATMGLRDAPSGLRSRVTGIALEHGDPPLAIEAGALVVEAVRIPHTGWPERQRDVQNLAYRVTLDRTATVVHLGDADSRDAHFARDAEHWARRRSQMAFPPYWFFLSEEGRLVLERRLAPDHAVGVHVPTGVPRRPEERPAALRARDLFQVPGETREIQGSPRSPARGTTAPDHEP